METPIKLHNPFPTFVKVLFYKNPFYRQLTFLQLRQFGFPFTMSSPPRSCLDFHHLYVTIFTDTNFTPRFSDFLTDKTMIILDPNLEELLRVLYKMNGKSFLSKSLINLNAPNIRDFWVIKWQVDTYKDYCYDLSLTSIRFNPCYVIDICNNIFLT